MNGLLTTIGPVNIAPDVDDPHSHFNTVERPLNRRPYRQRKRS
jgi:hypothetical protein